MVSIDITGNKEWVLLISQEIKKNAWVMIDITGNKGWDIIYITANKGCMGIIYIKGNKGYMDIIDNTANDMAMGCH